MVLFVLISPLANLCATVEYYRKQAIKKAMLTKISDLEIYHATHKLGTTALVTFICMYFEQVF